MRREVDTNQSREIHRDKEIGRDREPHRDQERVGERGGEIDGYATLRRFLENEALGSASVQVSATEHRKGREWEKTREGGERDDTGEGDEKREGDGKVTCSTHT